MARLEVPVLHGFDGFFVESHAEGAHHANVAGTAIGIHDHSVQVP